MEDIYIYIYIHIILTYVAEDQSHVTMAYNSSSCKVCIYIYMHTKYTYTCTYTLHAAFDDMKTGAHDRL